jgi:hypothetical protein
MVKAVAESSSMTLVSVVCKEAYNIHMHTIGQSWQFGHLSSHWYTYIEANSSTASVEFSLYWLC